ncbi:MAG: RDD family protein [Planctomycetes bacterium]|nr:RDD family protein [Planctomycetota bacterium]MCH9725766.1 RDD family protein [Planctomycetota bacterium]MCH9777821.1 RDD family protein [Planctomycetota bacterium]MCH9789914.1 RDD family protein [Planctomycetota bacterium]
MNPNGLCRKLQISEQQLSKICLHLGMTIPDQGDGEFNPAEIDRLQTFVAKKRSAANQKKQVVRQKQAVVQQSTTGNSVPVPAVEVARSNSSPTPSHPQATVSFPEENSAGIVNSASATEEASTGRRACAYIIDCLATFLLVPFVFVPILGLIIIGVFLLAYWLLRDVAGSSPGKLLLGMRVVHNSGDEYSVGPRIMRNLPLSIGPLLLCIPIIGVFIGSPVAIIMVLTEVIMLLATGRRLGDRLADTSVNMVPKL